VSVQVNKKILCSIWYIFYLILKIVTVKCNKTRKRGLPCFSDNPKYPPLKEFGQNPKDHLLDFQLMCFYVLSVDVVYFLIMLFSFQSNLRFTVLVTLVWSVATSTLGAGTWAGAKPITIRTINTEKNTPLISCLERFLWSQKNFLVRKF
jgi:hypothetical protein